MGQLIELGERVADRTRPRGRGRAAFFFDLACPFSYLAAEQAGRLLADVEWVPVAGAAAHLDAAGDDVRGRAERRAAELRLPLVWPESFPTEARGALRAAARAAQVGCGPTFTLAAARLAFCGGFDLEDPEVLVEAAAASGFELRQCLAAAGDESLDAALRVTARGLAARGVQCLPVVRVGQGFFAGEELLAQAAALSRAASGEALSAVHGAEQSHPWG